MVLWLETNLPALPCPPLCADSFPFKWINKKWKEGFFGEQGVACRGVGWGWGTRAGACGRQLKGFFCQTGCPPWFTPDLPPAPPLPCSAVTAMATSHSRWAVVMSRNAGFVDQVRRLPACRQPASGIEGPQRSYPAARSSFINAACPVCCRRRRRLCRSAWSWTSSTPPRASTGAGTRATASPAAQPRPTSQPWCSGVCV